MGKCLYHEEPMITSYPSTALMVMMLQSDPERYGAYLANLYVRLVCRDNSNELSRMDHELNFEDNQAAVNPGLVEHSPFIVYKLPRIFIQEKCLYFRDFVHYGIDKGFYIHICLNDAYLECSKYFNKQSRQHPATVYGYDDKSIYVADFWNGKYSQSAVSNESANMSFLANYIKEADNPGTDYMRDVYLIKLRDKKYEFRIDHLVEDLTDHLNSCDSTKKFCRSYTLGDSILYYGLQCYDIISRNLEDNLPDIRTFHLIYDHKVMMKYRLDYISSNRILSNDAVNRIAPICDEILNKSFILRNNVLKSQAKRITGEQIGCFKSALSEIRDADEMFTAKLLEELKQIC